MMDEDSKSADSDSDSSSSDSDACDYFKTTDKLDSSFFKIDKINVGQTSKNNVPSTSCLSDSDQAGDEPVPSTSTATPPPAETSGAFQHLIDYAKQLEDTQNKMLNFNQNISLDTALDIKSLLAVGELANEKLLHSVGTFDEDDDSSSSEMEEVESVDEVAPTAVPEKTLQITIDIPGMPKRKTYEEDAEAMLKRKINRVKKEYQVYIHKVHLLCWIAHGNHVNSVLNDEKLMALALSLIPSAHCYPDGRIDLGYMEQITKWYSKVIKRKVKHIEDNKVPFSLRDSLQIQMQKKEANTDKDYVLMFICILRSLGINCRLILSFRVLPLRPPKSELLSVSNLGEKNKAKRNVPETSIKSPSITPVTSKAKIKLEKNSKSKQTSDTQIAKKKLSLKSKSTSGQTKKLNTSSSSLDKPKPTKEVPGRKVAKKRSASLIIPQVDGANDFVPKKTSRTRSQAKLKKLDTSDTSSPERKMKISQRKSARNLSVPNEEVPKTKTTPSTVKSKPVKRSKSASNDSSVQNVKSPALKPASNSAKKVVKKRTTENRNVLKQSPKKRRLSEQSSEVEFDMKSKNKIKSKLHDLIKIDRRVLSSDSEDAANVKKKPMKLGTDTWIEVFLEDEEKWISVDVIKAQVHCVQEIYSRATSPVMYVVSWKNDGSIKDVTSRYCKNWNTVTRKLRVDPIWWTATLKRYAGRQTARDKEEDEELVRQQMDQPLPTTISEYKDHPLYALKRHLLKFEAIYPPDALILGFIRNEPVYARECVHTLHSREIWVKQARVVKPGETPYKIVKARPKYDKMLGKHITDLPLEIFGKWQTQDYEPPVAENGVVPRNAYGNVELFKACMLPIHTVHLRLPGLNKVARKLQIDCAPAVVGFDFHAGGSHPTFDGFVVCKEFRETLIAAWTQEQEEAEKRAQERVEKRVFGNWKRLIKGLLIRERLKLRYDFGTAETSTGGGGKSKKKKDKGPTFATKKRRIYSDSDSEESTK